MHVCVERKLFSFQADNNVHYSDSEYSSSDEVNVDNIMADGPLEEDHYQLLTDFLNLDQNQEVINENFTISRNDVLPAVLKYGRKNTLCNTALADLCKMINSFLVRPIIPDSRYMLDKFFFPEGGKDYHAVCPACKSYVKQFYPHETYITCGECEYVTHLKSACYRDYFVVLNFESELKSLVENNAEYYLEIMQRQGQEGSYKDIYDGDKYKEFQNSLTPEQRQAYLSLLFNADDVPLFKSSHFSFWPFQAVPNEILIKCRNLKPVTLVAWFGHDKPNMLYFLSPVVAKMNELSEIGLNCTLNENNVNIKVFGVCCCVDSIARAPMQGLIQFNGYFGCSWCLNPGQRVFHKKGYAVKYTVNGPVPDPRTLEESLVNIEDAVINKHIVQGWKKASPPLRLKKFNIVDSFVPDRLHCVDLGVSKQFAEYWLSSSNKPYSISMADILMMDKNMVNCKVPTIIAKLSRSILSRSAWTGLEWLNWALHYSLPCLSELLNFQAYRDHWSLLVEALFIMMEDDVSIANIERAQNLVLKFTTDCQILYTEDSMSFNVHQLQHLVESTQKWGPLWAHSGNTFENGNRLLLKMVHAAKGVLNQICRHLSQSESER